MDLWRPSVVCLFLLTTWSSAAAQQPVGQAASNASAVAAPVMTHEADGRVLVRATRIRQPIKIDGRLDEEVYREVPPITEFIQQFPQTGAPMTERTEAWILFDDENIYVACRCWQNPNEIVASDMRRDGQAQADQDHFAVGFDTFYDGHNGFQFTTSAAGGMRDGSLTDERYNTDWNEVWEGSSRKFEGGWITEMSVPFKSLRYQPGREQTWHIQMRRLIRSTNELGYLTLTNPAMNRAALQHFVVAPTLVGLEAPPAHRTFEIKPYGISKLTTDLVSDPVVRNNVKPDGGFDVKYGLTKGLTATATYNTDFAQVEADDAQVNLTRFSLQFAEKRDFFLEGQDIFKFGAGGRGDVNSPDAPVVFYSRRIGISGSRVVPVIAGGSVSGKAGEWSVGLLDMETAADENAGAVKTNFSVLRLRRNIMKRGTIGGIFTGRSASTVSPGSNGVWGLDSNFGFFENLWVSGYVANSHTENQGDDALSYRAQVNYNADRYGLAFDRIVVGKDFNPEVGFLRRKNFRSNFAQARFSPRTTQNPHVRKWSYEGTLDYVTDNNNRLQSRLAMGQFDAEFHNGDQFEVQYQSLYERLDVPFQIAQNVRIPTGGYPFTNTVVSYTGAQQRRAAGTMSVERGSFYDGDKTTVAFSRARVEITPQVSVEPTMSLNWINLPEGAFTTTIVGGRTTYTVTPRMFVAALIQYSSSSASISTNLRFRWEYRPGSDFFVVYSEGRTTLPVHGADLQSRGVAVKITRLFRF